MSSSLLIFDSAVVLCVLAVALRLVRTKVKRLPLPPGPRPWLLIGNVFDFPTTHEGRFYFRHKALYGELFSVFFSIHSLLGLLSYRAHQFNLFHEHDGDYHQRRTRRKRTPGEALLEHV